ncbi:MAG: PspC domain-containing protein [Bacteroidota bacterium]
MSKRLRRSDSKVIGGVCAGLAEYMDLDPVLVRVGYFLLSILTAFSGVLVYIILWIVLPDSRG